MASRTREKLTLNTAQAAPAPRTPASDTPNTEKLPWWKGVKEILTGLKCEMFSFGTFNKEKTQMGLAVASKYCENFVDTFSCVSVAPPPSLHVDEGEVGQLEQEVDQGAGREEVADGGGFVRLLD